MIARFVVGIGLVSACSHRASTPQPAKQAEVASFVPSEQTIRRAVAEAKAGRAQTFEFDVSTSIGFGCKCPPFVIGGGEENTFVMPAFGELPDPEAHYLLGQYRMRGHFDGREITAVQWRREAGRAYVAGESDAGWTVPQPSIVVEDWCFEPRWDSLEGWDPRSMVVDDLRALRALGRICPGPLPRDNELVAAVLAPADAE